ncbi:hypothetical protein J6590_043535 [Homalodisca vitripennis]|nr:hypothetical protein J6590_043535 [Homalodisca vitripennis]
MAVNHYPFNILAIYVDVRAENCMLEATRLACKAASHCGGVHTRLHLVVGCANSLNHPRSDRLTRSLRFKDAVVLSSSAFTGF